jgi:hypothetical protein
MSSASSRASCRHCSAASCVSYRSAPLCLLHYHAFSTHGKDDSIRALVTSEAEAARQRPRVEEVLRDAMTDVVLRMHELQQREQVALRQDPLSVLALHAPSATRNAAAMDVSAPSRRPAPSSDAIPKSKKLKKDDLWGVSSRATATGGENTAAGKGAKEDWGESEELQLRRQISGNDEDDSNDYLYPKGPPCSQCSSENTLMKYDSSSVGMSGTRGEVWGNKDNEGGHSKSTVICKACGFEKIQVSA